MKPRFIIANAFTAWVKLSDRHVRIVQPSGTDNRSDGRGACIPSEAVRMELQRKLAAAVDEAGNRETLGHVMLVRE